MREQGNNQQHNPNVSNVEKERGVLGAQPPILQTTVVMHIEVEEKSLMHDMVPLGPCYEKDISFTYNFENDGAQP